MFEQFRYDEFTFDFFVQRSERYYTVNGVKKPFAKYEIEGIMMPDGRIFSTSEIANHDGLILTVIKDHYPLIFAEIIKNHFYARAYANYEEDGFFSIVLDRALYEKYNIVYFSPHFGIKVYGKLTTEQVDKLHWLYDIGYYSYSDFYGHIVPMIETFS